MFKDAYKAANDDIRPDPYLLTRILNKAEEKPRSVFYNFRFAPIAAVIALAIAFSGLLNNPGDTGTNVLDNNSPSMTNQTADTYLLPKITDDTKPLPQTDCLFPYEEENNDTVSDTPSMTIVMSVNDFEQTAALAQSRMIAADDYEIIEEIEELSAKEYFDNLGFSPDMLVIPEGLTADFNSDSTVTVTRREGKIISDENTFTYNGANFLSVTTSSKTETALSHIENEQYEKSVFGDKNAVVLFDGSVYQAHIIHSSGTAVKIVTDMPEENLKVLLASIAE